MWQIRQGIKVRMIAGLLIVALGAFVSGFGLKFSWVWWMTMPNFVDGLATTVAGLLLIILASYYCFNLLPKQEGGS